MRVCQEKTLTGAQCKNKSTVGICPTHLKKLREENKAFKLLIGEMETEKKVTAESVLNRMCSLRGTVREYMDLVKTTREGLAVYDRLAEASMARIEEYKEEMANLTKGLTVAAEITEDLSEKLKFSISHDAISKVKEGEHMEIEVATASGKLRHFVLMTRSYIGGLITKENDNKINIAALHREITRLKKVIAKKPVIRDRPTDNHKEIKKENEKLNKAVGSLKERVAVHSAISKVCYTYEAFDKYINDTVERITGHIRDYPAGIYNKITDFMRIKNISKICYSDLGITASDFYKQFIDLRNDRNRTCHPELKKRDKKRITDFIVDYLN